MNGRHFGAFEAPKYTLETGFKSGQVVHLGEIMKKG
jgi:hypothetical protein